LIDFAVPCSKLGLKLFIQSLDRGQSNAVGIDHDASAMGARRAGAGCIASTPRAKSANSSNVGAAAVEVRAHTARSETTARLLNRVKE
jgi:hypothetical protein